MKAKEYYEKLKICETKEQLEEEILNILNSLVQETEDLIKSRRCAQYAAIRAAVSEINNKWHALVRLFNKEENEFEVKLNDDGFYLVLVELKPEFKKYFEKEVKRGMVTIKELEDRQKKLEERNNIPFHVLTPLKEITNDNIVTEILCCLQALGSYAGLGIPLQFMKPLAYRIRFLRFWKSKGIDYNMIDEFESNPEEFLDKYNVPV